MKKDKILEALLVINAAMVLLYLIYKQDWFLYLALLLGIISILSLSLSKLIARGWYKLGEWMGWFVSKVILLLLYYLLLVPVALMNRIFQPDKLRLKANKQSFWVERNHGYTPDDFKNSW